jgi:hypothetical protein
MKTTNDKNAKKGRLHTEGATSFQVGEILKRERTD